MKDKLNIFVICNVTLCMSQMSHTVPGLLSTLVKHRKNYSITRKHMMLLAF